MRGRPHPGPPQGEGACGMKGVAHDVSHAFAYFRMRGGAIFAYLRSLRSLRLIKKAPFVKLILNLTAKPGGTFQNFPASLPNFQISRRSKSRGFYGQKIAAFATNCYTITYKQKAPSDSPKGGAWASRKGRAGLQRGCYCIATAAPLQHDGVLVATPRGPRCSTKPSFWSKNNHQKLANFCKI